MDNKNYHDESIDEVVFFDDELEDEPVFKAMDSGADMVDGGFVDESVGFEEEDIERGFDDGELALLPPMLARSSMIDEFASEPSAPGYAADAPCATLSLEALVASSGMDLVAPALKPAPFFLDETHFETSASAGMILVAIASMLIQSDMAAEFSESKAKFKVVHYSGADYSEFRVYVHRRESGDHVVEFCRRAGSRTLFSQLYKNVVAELAGKGIVPAASVPRAPVDISAPLPVPQVEEEAVASVGPSSEPSEAQKLADSLMALPEDSLVDSNTLAKACKLLGSVDLVDDIDPLASSGPVARLVNMAGSASPGVARAAVQILAEISALVSSERGPDELSLSFGPNAKALAASLRTVFRHSDGLRNFRYSPLFSKALELIATLSVDEQVCKLLIDNGVAELVARLRDSPAHSKALHEQANVAFMTLCVA